MMKQKQFLSTIYQNVFNTRRTICIYPSVCPLIQTFLHQPYASNTSEKNHQPRLLQSYRYYISSSESSSNTGTSNTTTTTSSSSSWERSAKLVKNLNVANNKYVNQIRETHDPALQLKTLEDELKGTIGKALGKQGEKVEQALIHMRFYLKEYTILIQKQRQQQRQQQQQQEQNSYQDMDNTNNYKGKRHSSTSNNIYDGDTSSDGNSKHMHEKIKECVTQYNKYRQDAIKARWELTVHRQAVGFIVNNHNFVQEMYPIPGPLSIVDVVESDDHYGNKVTISTTNNNSNRKQSDNQNDKKVIKSTQFGDQLDWWQKIGRWK